MSWYTVFDQREPTVTTTTTSLLAATDPVLIASANQKHASQTTVGSISALQSVTTITTLTTGTAVPAYGMSVFNTTGGSANTVTWTLADPLVAGICKTLFCISTSTTTPVALTILFASATGISTDVTSGSIVSVGFGQAASPYGGYIELEAISTSQWAVVGRSAANSRSS